jgi:hypothetical protein
MGADCASTAGGHTLHRTLANWLQMGGGFTSPTGSGTWKGKKGRCSILFSLLSGTYF